MRVAVVSILVVASACDDGVTAICLCDAGSIIWDDGLYPGHCNPVAQTGCSPGEKCTWQAVTDTLGRIACVPDGTVALGSECLVLAPGETAGYDDCVAGAYCLSGTCEEICADAPDSCDTTVSACSVYPSLFLGAEFTIGVCDPTCEPGPQTRVSDGAAACGGIVEHPRGCYGWTTDSVPTFVCMPDVSDARHGEMPDPLSPDGIPHMYSCDAGYFPSMNEPHACTAFCVPAETHSGLPDNSDGLAPFSCTDRGAIAPGSMECRYFHPFIASPDARYNGSGMCVDTSATGIPRCVDLGTDLIDTDGDGAPDTPEHQHWGCAPWSE